MSGASADLTVMPAWAKEATERYHSYAHAAHNEKLFEIRLLVAGKAGALFELLSLYGFEPEVVHPETVHRLPLSGGT